MYAVRWFGGVPRGLCNKADTQRGRAQAARELREEICCRLDQGPRSKRRVVVYEHSVVIKAGVYFASVEREVERRERCLGQAVVGERHILGSEPAQRAAARVLDRAVAVGDRLERGGISVSTGV